MSDAITATGVCFDAPATRSVHVRFDQPQSSSDGGAILLKVADERLGLTAALGACLRDWRHPSRIRHSMTDLVRQRVFGVAAGYEDCNDAARLSADPMARLLLGRDPVAGAPIASQPSLCRFENGIDVRSIVRLGRTLADTVIARQARRRAGRARRITIDLDPTDDPTHGTQQLSSFNAYYDTWCYLPVAGFATFDDDPEAHLVAWVLRPGTARAGDGARAILSRLFVRLRRAFPEAVLRVRLDAGFADAELLEFLDEEQVEYVVALQGYATLAREAAEAMERVRQASFNSGGPEREYLDCEYAAASWSGERRVVIKAQVVRLEGRGAKDNARFVATNLTQSARFVYEQVYCRRAVIENRFKELLHGLAIGRTSCRGFLANQVRGLLAAAAYVLYQEIRAAAVGTALAAAQVTTLRERLVKLGVRVSSSTRRIGLQLPDSAPWRDDWVRIARALGAAPAPG